MQRGGHASLLQRLYRPGPQGDRVGTDQPWLGQPWLDQPRLRPALDKLALAGSTSVGPSLAGSTSVEPFSAARVNPGWVDPGWDSQGCDHPGWRGRESFWRITTHAKHAGDPGGGRGHPPPPWVGDPHWTQRGLRHNTKAEWPCCASSGLLR